MRWTSKLAYFLVLWPAFTSHSSADTACNAAALPITGTRIVNVSTEPQLQTAMGNLQNGDTIVLSNGVYNLSNSLYINGRNNVTIRGNSGCDGVVLAGLGMDHPASVPHGVWSNSSNTVIAHLTIRDTWDNAIIFNSGAQAPRVYSVKLLDAGSQFIKANPTDAPNGIGVNNGVVEYSWLEYTNGPPATDHGAGTGYTNGISAHAADDWILRANVFKDFHTPDSADYLWNPAVLMWNHSTNTLTERNTFINVDRAVAYGLSDITGFDHEGGIIRNNFVYLEPGLMTPARKTGSDGAIIAWDSPDTQIDHNTILSNGNINYAIQFRFSSTAGGTARNNLTDIPIHLRDSATATLSGNLDSATSGMFVNPSAANLHLQGTATNAIDQAPSLPAVSDDFDGESRPQGAQSDIGADEFPASPPPCLFCDDFNNDILDPAWSYVKPDWEESGGSLRGTPPRKKAIAIATPFAGCTSCSVEAVVSVTGGNGNKIWILGWYVDKRNRIELLIKEDQDKMILKQRYGGQVVAKQKGTAAILPDTSYPVRVAFDGAQFTVLFNGNPLFMMSPNSPVPSGTVGFEVSNTSAAFDSIQVQ